MEAVRSTEIPEQIKYTTRCQKSKYGLHLNRAHYFRVHSTMLLIVCYNSVFEPVNWHCVSVLLAVVTIMQKITLQTNHHQLTPRSRICRVLLCFNFASSWPIVSKNCYYSSSNSVVLRRASGLTFVARRTVGPLVFLPRKTSGYQKVSGQWRSHLSRSLFFFLTNDVDEWIVLEGEEKSVTC
jgi:hypothetical protein